jgi:hypothetical protein
MAKETTIVTDILAPEREYVAEYTVNNPAKLLGVMLELMKGVWRIPSASVYTDKIKWDVTGEKTEFYGEWRAKDKKDGRTIVWNRIIVQGTQDPKTKDGTATIKLKPMMQTKIESATAIDRAVRMFYLNSFYKEQMRAYVAGAKRRVNDFDEAIRLTLNIEEREARTRPAGRM